MACFFPHSRLRTLGIEFPFLVAPMVGLSHVAFRELVRSYLPSGLKALRFTEMLSTRRLPSERLDTTNELKSAPGENFFVPQLLGNEEKYIAPSLAKLRTLSPWGFDINMGCPVSHTLKHNWGVRLMGDQDYAASVVRATKRHAALPVSIKLRGGKEDTLDTDYLLRFTEAMEEAGVDWMTIHPRPRAAGHKGEANWELVRIVRNARSLPVVANGDIQTADDALEILGSYGVDGAMVARAATARPWILWQIAERLGYPHAPEGFAGQRAPRSPEEEGAAYNAACLKLLALLKEYFGDGEYALEKFRFFVATGSRWFFFGHAFWKMTTKAKSLAELQDRVYEFGQKSENPMYGRIKN